MTICVKQSGVRMGQQIGRFLARHVEQPSLHEALIRDATPFRQRSMATSKSERKRRSTGRVGNSVRITENSSSAGSISPM